jgi:hypothetical protein
LWHEDGSFVKWSVVGWNHAHGGLDFIYSGDLYNPVIAMMVFREGMRYQEIAALNDSLACLYPDII